MGDLEQGCLETLRWQWWSRCTCWLRSVDPGWPRAEFGLHRKVGKEPTVSLGVVVEDTGGVAVAATGGNVGVLVALGIGGGALLLLGGAVGWWKLLLLGGGVGN